MDSSTKPRSRQPLFWWTAILAAVGLALPAAYIIGYVWLGEYTYVHSKRGPAEVRVFSHDWMIHAYAPLARLESRMTGRPVRLVGPGIKWE